ncbi:MAG: VWA domain-containing protein [Cyanobacteria bacterium P01_A01_bin.45]
MSNINKIFLFCGFTLIAASLISCGGQNSSQLSETSAPVIENLNRNKSPQLKSKSQLDSKKSDTSSSLPNSEKSEEYNREQYKYIQENPFVRVISNPLSTFSIDVDTASYSNIRRFINNGQKPPKDAVRLEEMINYFKYDYPQPTQNTPLSVNTEVAPALWNSKHKLVQIGLQSLPTSVENLPTNNLVFLLDVSGSMGEPDKLPLLKSAIRLLVNQMRPQDKVSIIVYAGKAGVVLPATPGSEKDKILDALEKLEAGGSTAGGQGIKLAYKIAKDNFLKDGNNRVILATDGDFNVGASSDAALVRMIEKERDQGIFLTVLGFGSSNYQDNKMEQLANTGNGNYAYIDNLLEAKKVLIKEMGATLLTVAKDVKLQVEFNPQKVQAYRLIGYENRLLADQDFNDDKKDAGEIGAGHSVTALYEIIPVGVEIDVPISQIDPLKYQKPKQIGNNSNELMQVKLRYKLPEQSKSQLKNYTIVDKGLTLDNASENFKFSSSVASFGMLLRDSKYKGTATLDKVLQLARQSQGADLNGYRAEFIRLVDKSKKLGIEN